MVQKVEEGEVDWGETLLSSFVAFRIWNTDDTPGRLCSGTCRCGNNREVVVVDAEWCSLCLLVETKASMGCLEIVVVVVVVVVAREEGTILSKARPTKTPPMSRKSLFGWHLRCRTMILVNLLISYDPRNSGCCREEQLI